MNTGILILESTFAVYTEYCTAQITPAGKKVIFKCWVCCLPIALSPQASRVIALG